MPEMSIGMAIRTHAESDPDRPMLTCGDITLTRAEVDRHTNRLARAYERLGVDHGDLVTIALPNSAEFMLATIAVWKLGATPQPVSARLPDRELEEIVELADPALVIGVTPGRLPERGTVPIDYRPDPDLPDGPLPDRISPSYKAPTSGGSTGRPKIIVSSHDGVFDTDAPSPFLPTDKTVLVPGALYHNAPLTTSAGALVGGNHLINMERFDPEGMLRLIHEHRPTFLYMVPTMMQRAWKLPEETKARYDLSSLEVAVHMAAPCAAWLKERWIEWVGPDVLCELYGGTEQQSLTWITGREWLEHPGSVGRPYTGEMKVFDDDGDEVPPGVIGEIYMRADDGPGSTYTYLGAEARTIGEWESIGDMGYIDHDGYVYLADRRTDLILRGGANVYPAEVEAALDLHAAVRSCAVIGLPDEDLGQAVHAIVDAPDGVTEIELRRHMVDHLAPYKCPTSYEFVAEPVRDDAGKVRRSRLAQERANRSRE